MVNLAESKIPQDSPAPPLSATAAESSARASMAAASALDPRRSSPQRYRLPVHAEVDGRFLPGQFSRQLRQSQRPILGDPLPAVRPRDVLDSSSAGQARNTTWAVRQDQRLIPHAKVALLPPEMVRVYASRLPRARPARELSSLDSLDLRDENVVLAPEPPGRGGLSSEAPSGYKFPGALASVFLSQASNTHEG